jgi:hypothetical protein
MTDQRSSGAHVIPLPAPAPVASVQGSLALDLLPRVEPPRARLRAARACDLVAAEDLSREHVDAFVQRCLQAVAEIAVGDRPVTQVLRHCVPEVYADLGERARQVVAAAGGTAARARGASAARPVVRSVRTSLVRADALEASAHVRYGRRSRAVAARFEVVRDRWQCVALEWD